MEGDWPEQVRHKLEEQGLDPALAERLASEVARASESLAGDARQLRAAARLHLLLGLRVLASAQTGAILNFLLHAYALVCLVAGAAAVWGAILCRRGLILWRLSRRAQRRA
jgi:hypothetical protein